MNYLILIFSIMTLGCGSDKTTPSDPKNTNDKEYYTCAAKLRLDCPNGYVDGCELQDNDSLSGFLTTHHVCVNAATTRGIECEAEVDIECDVKEKDACLNNPTLAETHICVRDSESH